MMVFEFGSAATLKDLIIAADESSVPNPSLENFIIFVLLRCIGFSRNCRRRLPASLAPGAQPAEARVEWWDASPSREIPRLPIASGGRAPALKHFLPAP